MLHRRGPRLELDDEDEQLDEELLDEEEQLDEELDEEEQLDDEELLDEEEQLDEEEEEDEEQLGVFFDLLLDLLFEGQSVLELDCEGQGLRSEDDELEEQDFDFLWCFFLSSFFEGTSFFSLTSSFGGVTFFSLTSSFVTVSFSFFFGASLVSFFGVSLTKEYFLTTTPSARFDTERRFGATAFLVAETAWLGAAFPEEILRAIWCF